MQLEIECTWMRESHIDWIFKGPASMAILVNLVFLIRIMWASIHLIALGNLLCAIFGYLFVSLSSSH